MFIRLFVTCAMLAADDVHSSREFLWPHAEQLLRQNCCKPLEAPDSVQSRRFEREQGAGL